MTRNSLIELQTHFYHTGELYESITQYLSMTLSKIFSKEWIYLSTVYLCSEEIRPAKDYEGYRLMLEYLIIHTVIGSFLQHRYYRSTRLLTCKVPGLQMLLSFDYAAAAMQWL